MGKSEEKRVPRLRTAPPVPGWLPEHKLIEDADAIGDERVGLVLLWALRDLRLWVESTPEERSHLLLPPSQTRIDTFAHAAEHADGIAEALQDLSAMRSEPERLTPTALSEACRRIYKWADRKALAWVAVHFAEAAARVDPAASVIACDAGRVARFAALPDRADLWYDRAIRIAARHGSKNRGELIRALLGRAALLRQQRKFDEVRPLLTRAAKLSASTRRYRLAAETQHDLFALAVMDGTYAEAESHMMLALDYYPIHHPAITRLVHDWAFLLVQNALYSQAVPLLRASIPQVRRLEIQLLSWGTLSHAAAGMQCRDLYNEAVIHALNIAERVQEYAAAALAHAATGARFFAEWELGQAYAIRAGEIAHMRGELEAEHWIQEIKEAIRVRQSPPPQADPPEGSQFAVVADRIFKVLEARKRPSRRPVQVDSDKEAGGPPLPARRGNPDH